MPVMTTLLNETLFPVTLTQQGVRLIDQTLLPSTFTHVLIETPAAMADAITTMIVRGAPAIGIAGAYGLVLAARQGLAAGDSAAALMQRLHAEAQPLRAARPTAVNLVWAVNAVIQAAEVALLQEVSPSAEALAGVVEAKAVAIHEADLAGNVAMGRFGASLMPPMARIQTHCNAGALATAGHGTALGVIREAYAQGRCQHVFADETRPRNQGGKLTTWELMQDGIPVTLVCDNMAATLHSQGKVDAVIVGADRITANGDTANKIGTHTLALVAAAFGTPFYVAAPLSTIDASLAHGGLIPIEERCGSEITHASDALALAPEGVATFNPGFDVTPNHLIRAIITEKGIAYPPYEESLAALLADA